MTHRLIGIGEVLWDHLPSGKQLGGAPANFAYHAASLGADGIVVSRVGDDASGRELLARLGSLGLDTAHISVDRDHRTGAVSVTVDPDGKPAYTIETDAAWDFISDDAGSMRLLGEADALCFGSLAQRSETSRSAIRALVDHARPGAVRIFDVNLRQEFFSREVLESSFRSANVLKMSDEELPVVADLLGVGGSEREILDLLAARYRPRLIALTRGERGSLLIAADRSSSHPGHRTVVVDTVGAGDAFSAALALGMLEGYDLDRLNDYANRVAAFVCSRAGATPPIPDDLRISA